MEVNHVCEFCNKSFSNKYCLKTHLKIHDERERNFQCECGKQFLKEIHLRNHKLTIHSGNNKNFICDICSKAFKSSNNLRTHEAVHSERAYLCRYCEKTFLRLQDVRIHEKTHKKLREFHCMEKSCNKTFNQQSNLLSHIKTVHKQLKNHICNLCKKSYKRRRLLNFHMVKAHGVEEAAKIIKCDQCSFQTVYPSHMRTHILKHAKHELDCGKLKLKELKIEKL